MNSHLYEDSSLRLCEFFSLIVRFKLTFEVSVISVTRVKIAVSYFSGTLSYGQLSTVINKGNEITRGVEGANVPTLDCELELE